MNEQTTPETEVSQGITEEQAMQQLLGKWTKAEPEAETPAEEPEAEQTEEVDAPVEEASAEEPAEDGEIEIDVAGEKFKVPTSQSELAKRIEAKAKEVEAGATRKFQEAADIRKAVESERAAVEQLRKFAEAHSDLLADRAMVAKRLQQLEGIDIHNTDSDTLTRLNAEYNQLQAAARRIEQSMQESAAKMSEEDQKATAAKLELATKQIQTRIKNWGPEKQKSLVEYALSRGAPAEALAGITDAWMVEILDDAAYGRQMREHRPDITKRVAQAQATLRPGSGASKTPTVVKADEAMTRLKKSGRPEDAVAALLARSQARKR